MTFEGRIVILTVWVIMSAVALVGALNVETEFSMNWLITPGSNTWKFFEMDAKFFKTGYGTDIIIDAFDTDFASAETQY